MDKVTTVCQQARILDMGRWKQCKMHDKITKSFNIDRKKIKLRDIDRKIDKCAGYS